MWIRRAAPLALAWAACVEQTPDQPSKQDQRLIAQNVLEQAPTPRIAVGAELDDKLVYVGLDAPEKLAAGRSFKLVHYWRVVKEVGDDWKLFVHVNGAGRDGYINADHVPVRGRYPVDRWKAGQIVRDEHSVTLPRGWKADQAEIYVGIWRGEDRLRVVKGPSDGKNRVLAATIPVSREAKDASARKRYVARRADGAIVIDGALDEPAWAKAASSGPFVDTLTGAAVEGRALAKAMWDDTHLYVGFEVQDREVASTLRKHDDKLWTQDVVEMFIDADGDGKDYVELQVSPAGVTFDSFLPAHRKNQNDWESGMKAAVKVDGTLNEAGDADRGWTAELALPLAAVKGRAKDKTVKMPGEAGALWRINWFRMDGQGAAQKAAGWSPPLVGDFHALDRFGELRFLDPARAGLSAGAIKSLRERAGQKILKRATPPGP